MSDIEKLKKNKYAWKVLEMIGFNEELELHGEFNGEPYVLKAYIGSDSWSGGEMIFVASAYEIEEEGEELMFNEEEAISLSEFMLMYGAIV